MSAKGINAAVTWTEHLPHFFYILKIGLCERKLFINQK